MKNIIIAVVITALLIGGYLGYHYYKQNRGTPPTPVTPPESVEKPSPPDEQPPGAEEGTETGSAAVESTSETEPPPLPALGESDPVFRETLEALSPTKGSEERDKKDEILDKVLKQKNLIRKVVTAVDLVGREKNPWKLFNFLSVKGRLVVEHRDGKIYLSPKNYDRYDTFVETVAELDPVLIAEAYQRFRPLFVEAFDELGNEGIDWPTRLAAVMDDLNKLDVDDSDIELIGREGVYIFADPRLEALSPAHKLLIRIGPEHTRTLRTKLEAVRQRLGPL